MTPAGEWVDPLKRVISDRTHVLEYVEHLEQVLSLLDGGVVWDRTEQVEQFLARSVVEHFAFEETVVFPALLSGANASGCKELILELVAEHATILKGLDQFRKIMAENPIQPLDQETSRRVYTIVRKIIDDLLRHASKEDDRLLPIIEMDKAMLRQWMLENEEPGRLPPA